MIRWGKLIAIVASSINLVTATAILGVSAYEIADSTLKGLHQAVPAARTLRGHVVELLPVMVFIITTGLLSPWGITRRKKMCTAVLVALLHVVSLALVSTYSNFLSYLAHTAEESAPAMKNRTLAIFQRHAKHRHDDLRWLPRWLDEIQQESPTCCGIINYRDWEDFWPLLGKEVPVSCCRVDPEECDTSFDGMDWPKKKKHSPNPIKTYEGCAADINAIVQGVIRKFLKLLIFLNVCLAVAFVAVIFQYILEFCRRARNELTDDAKSLPDLSVDETWARMGFSESIYGNPNRLHNMATTPEAKNSADDNLVVFESYLDFQGSSDDVMVTAPTSLSGSDENTVVVEAAPAASQTSKVFRQTDDAGIDAGVTTLEKGTPSTNIKSSTEEPAVHQDSQSVQQSVQSAFRRAKGKLDSLLKFKRKPKK